MDNILRILLIIIQDNDDDLKNLTYQEILDLLVDCEDYGKDVVDGKDSDEETSLFYFPGVEVS